MATVADVLTAYSLTNATDPRVPAKTEAGFRSALATIQPPALNVAFVEAVRLDPVVRSGSPNPGVTFKNLKTMLEFLSLGDAASRAGVLIALYAATGKKAPSLPEPFHPFWPILGRFLEELPPGRDASYLVPFMQNQRPDSLLAALKPMSDAIGSVKLLLTMLDRIALAGGKPALMAAHNVVFLKDLYDLVPPGARFPHFDEWGEGDHGDYARQGEDDRGCVESNVRWHFLKHVLGMKEQRVRREVAQAVGAGSFSAYGPFQERVDAIGQWAPYLAFPGASQAVAERIAAIAEDAIDALYESPDIYPDECAFWWGALGITLRWSEYKALASGGPSPGDDAWFNIDHTGDGPLVNVRALVSQNLSRHPRLVAALTEAHLDAYRDYPLNASKVMQPRVVLADLGGAFVAGISGRVFMIGRRKWGASKIRLSSCYYLIDGNVQPKTDMMTNRGIWSLNP